MVIRQGLRAVSGFSFQTTKSLYWKIGASKQTGALVRQAISPQASNGATVLLCTDKGVLENKLERACVDSLVGEGLNVVTFDGVVADPPEHVVHEAVQLAKANNVSCVVGLGGGSSLDVAKLVAFLANPGASQSLGEIYGVEACEGSRLPLFQIPTTAGTGSEVTPISIVTTGEKEKKGIVSSVLLPDAAILDGELTKSLPAHVTAATGIDAMVHAIEAYTSKFKKNALSDMFAREALHILGTNIQVAVHEPGNVEARSNMLLGSMYAGMAFANAPVAAVHALAYPIGSHFSVPHGLSNALMLPHVLRFNEAAAGKEYEELKSIMFPQAAEGGTLADCCMDLARELGMPLNLKAVGITEDDIETLATEAMKQTRLLPNNPREVTKDDAIAMYSDALA